MIIISKISVIFDNHLHLRREGRFLEAVKDFYKDGGTHFVLCQLPMTNLVIRNKCYRSSIWRPGRMVFLPIRALRQVAAIRAVRRHRPKALNRQGVLVDILPPPVQDPAVGQQGGVELVDVVDRNRIRVASVSIHDMQNVDAAVETRHKTVRASRRE